MFASLTLLIFVTIDICNYFNVKIIELRFLKKENMYIIYKIHVVVTRSLFEADISEVDISS